MRQITIFTGGSGTRYLQRDFHKLDPSIRVNLIMNLFDDGLSTGIVRKIYDVLGPSDLRKNQWFRYSLINEKTDPIIDSFFNDRFDLTDAFDAGQVLGHVFDKSASKEILEGFYERLDDYIEYVATEGEKIDIEKNLKEFNLANIVYGHYFKKYGVLQTIEIFNELLKLDEDDNVKFIPNTIWNVNITASGESNDGEYFILDEAGISNLNDANRKIRSVYISEEWYTERMTNMDMIEAMLDSDAIIVGTGTQWSSIIPTISNHRVLNILNAIPHYVLINKDQDKDNLGVDSDGFIGNYHSIGLKEENSIYVFDNDADESMRIKKEYFNYVTYMSSIEGVALTIFRDWYQNRKDIAVIMPVYKAHDTIISTVSSVMNQHGVSFQLYLIVDEEGQGQYDLLKEMFPGVIILYTDDNRGANVVRNIGIRLSKEDYITFMDSDDLYTSVFSLDYLMKGFLEDDVVISASNFTKEMSDGSFEVKSEDSLGHLHGKIYKRSFLELYNIRFNDEENHLVNDDICFNTGCLLFVKDDHTRYLFNDQISTYLWKYNTESITKKDDFEFTRSGKDIRGLVTNKIYAFKRALKNEVDMKTFKLYLLQTLIGIRKQYYAEDKLRRYGTKEYIEMLDEWTDKMFTYTKPFLKDYEITKEKIKFYLDSDVKDDEVDQTYEFITKRLI